MCNADHTKGGVRVIIFPAVIEITALKRVNEFNDLLMKEFEGSSHQDTP
jgi:hypothetical protein